MSQFWWIPISYVIYVSALEINNGIATYSNHPIVATGFLTQWYFVMIVFLITYISEWAMILYNKS